MANQFPVSDDQRIHIETLLDQIKRMVGFPNGSPVDPDEIIKALEKISDP